MTTRDDKSDWSGCPDTLVEFVGWYAERSVGRSAMYSPSNILESIPAVLDVEVRTAWYAGEDMHKQDLAGVATDVVLLFEHVMVGKGRESALHMQNEREMEMTTQEQELEIVVRYRAVDGYGETRKYKTVAGAAWFVRKWLGRHPDCHGTHSGVSADGVSRVRITGSPVEVYELVQLGEMLLRRRGG